MTDSGAASSPAPGPATASGRIEIVPTPTDEEVVAIMAATEALWPRPVVVAAAAEPRRAAWRFSGRWWSLPLPVRRDRPYH